MNDDKPIRWQLYQALDPTVERIIPQLAVEVGLNESIILMQISHWIGISQNVQNGVYWTYHSLREMHSKYFPYWSVATIRRTLQSLADKQYIFIGNFNKRKGDNTQWFALNPDKLSSLTSVLVMPAQKVYQNETGVYQNETPPLQNETTLPEITTETTPKKKTTPRKRDELYDAIAEVWHTIASGQIVMIKAMMTGSGKKGSQWGLCNFDPPVTSGDEIRAFGVYAKQRMAEKNIQDMPTVAVTIQRWFYDFRLTQQKQAGESRGKTKADEQMEINRLAMREANGTL